MVEALAQQIQRAPRMLRGQACFQSGQAPWPLHGGPGHAAGAAPVIDTLGLLLQTLAGMAQAAGQAVQAHGVAVQAITHAQYQTLLQAVQPLLQIGTARRQQLCRRGRRRGAHIGDEVGDGHIGLMANRADDRRDAGIHRTRHGFLVEAPEIFQRAPPRARIRASKPWASASCSARTICPVASRPCTAVGISVSSTCGARRRNTEMMSRITAPVGELTMPMRRG